MPGYEVREVVVVSTVGVRAKPDAERLEELARDRVSFWVRASYRDMKIMDIITYTVPV